jgi:hypothetical protein
MQTKPVTRWVIAKPSDIEGYRQLALPAQGRHTFESELEALRWLVAYYRGGTALGTNLSVEPWDCWPNHFDPMVVIKKT